MRMKFLSLTVLVLWLGACQPGSSTINESEGTVQVTDSEQLSLGPIRHDSLTEKQVARITRIQRVFAEVYPASLEQTINDFKRDAHPDREIAVWESMATAYEQYLHNQPNPLGLPRKKEAFALLLSRSMMPENEAIRNANLKLLTAADAKQIMACYEAAPKPITID